VGGQVLEDDVNVLACVRFHRGFKEGQELCAIAGRAAVAVDLARADIECGEQVGSAVPNVVMGAVSR
jgi:hypothetical protein